MRFSTDQMRRLQEPMEAYELTVSSGAMVLNQMHIQKIKRVAIEIGEQALFCNTCTDEIMQFIKPIYELYKSQELK